MTVGYSEMGTRVGTVGYGRAAPQTSFTSCQIGDIEGYRGGGREGGGVRDSIFRTNRCSKGEM